MSANVTEAAPAVVLGDDGRAGPLSLSVGQVRVTLCCRTGDHTGLLYTADKGRQPRGPAADRLERTGHGDHAASALCRDPIAASLESRDAVACTIGSRGGCHPLPWLEAGAAVRMARHPCGWRAASPHPAFGSPLLRLARPQHPPRLAHPGLLLRRLCLGAGTVPAVFGAAAAAVGPPHGPPRCKQQCTAQHITAQLLTHLASSAVDTCSLHNFKCRQGPQPHH